MGDVVVTSFVNLELEIFCGSLLPEVAVVGKIRPSAALFSFSVQALNLYEK